MSSYTCQKYRFSYRVCAVADFLGRFSSLSISDWNFYFVSFEVFLSDTIRPPLSLLRSGGFRLWFTFAQAFDPSHLCEI